MTTLTVSATLTQSGGQPATGLTLADIDFYLTRINRSTGVADVVWNGTQHPTVEIDNTGQYARIYSSADFVTYDYFFLAQYTGAIALDVDYVSGQAGEGTQLTLAEIIYPWGLSQSHEIDFLLTDSLGEPVAGLGSGFTVELRKVGGSFVAGAGTKAEIGSGIYRYTNTADEADTPGPVSIRVTGTGIIQRSLLAIVATLAPGAVEWAYVVTNSTTANPEPGVEVWITTDVAGLSIVASGFVSDTFGVARDAGGNLPRLDPGDYYFWKYKAGFVDDDNPDLETVS